MGGNDTRKHLGNILENTHKKSKIEAVTKMDDCFTKCHYKTEEPANVEIFTLISLKVWLFWCETRMFSLNPIWLPSKLIIKSRGLKL